MATGTLCSVLALLQILSAWERTTISMRACRSKRLPSRPSCNRHANVVSGVHMPWGVTSLTLLLNACPGCATTRDSRSAFP